jgi:hypothetical protein
MEEQKIIRRLMESSNSATSAPPVVEELQIHDSDFEEEVDDGKDPEYGVTPKKQKKTTPKTKRPAKIAKTPKTPTISKAKQAAVTTPTVADVTYTVKDVPQPPSLQEHIENMFSNRIQSLHMIWILQANKRGIVSDTDADRLQFLPYNNQSPFFIVTLFLVLYEALRISNDEQARKKWADDGLILFAEILDMIERRRQ